MFNLSRVLKLNKTLGEASKICAEIPSFGEVLDEIRVRRELTQRRLAEKISRSEAAVSSLLNNEIPQKFSISEVHEIAKQLKCDEVELAKLVTASVCYLLSTYELIDLDQF